MNVLNNSVIYHIGAFLSVTDKKAVKNVVDTLLEDPYFTKRKAGVLSLTTHPINDGDAKLLISILMVLPHDAAQAPPKVLTPEQNQMISAMLMQRLIMENPNVMHGWKLTTFDSYEAVSGIVDVLLNQVIKPTEPAQAEPPKEDADA